MRWKDEVNEDLREKGWLRGEALDRGEDGGKEEFKVEMWTSYKNGISFTEKQIRQSF